jgi:hypothetical protein
LRQFSTYSIHGTATYKLVKKIKIAKYLHVIYSFFDHLQKKQQCKTPEAAANNSSAYYRRLVFFW